MAQEQPAVEVGSEIGAYRLTSPIGAGGMGVVYQAEHTQTGDTVAIKLLTPDLARVSGFRHRFARESEYANTIEHPNIVEVYEAGEAGGVLFIAMKYVDGEDLKTLLHRQGPLEPEQAANCSSQIADALDAAHSVGLLHRDVKPGNIMIVTAPGEEAGKSYLTDFGPQQEPSSDSIALTAAGRVRGHHRLHGARADPRQGRRPPRGRVRARAACSTSASPARCPTRRRARWRCSTHTSRTRRRRSPTSAPTCLPRSTT